MGLNLFVYRLPFLVTFLAYEQLGNWEFDTLQKTENEATEIKVFFFCEIVNNRACFVFRDRQNSIKLIFVHRINAK